MEVKRGSPPPNKDLFCGNPALSKISKRAFRNPERLFLCFKAYSIDEARQMDTLSNWESFLT